VIYWLAVTLGLIPRECLCEDYGNPIPVAWNWSGFPLNMLVSATGLTGLYPHGRVLRPGGAS
jgi:hypothetical protein